MNATRRTVFDTATLLGAALRPASPADRALSLTLRYGVLCASEQLLEATQSLMRRSKLDRYMARGARMAFIEMLHRAAWICSVTAADLSPSLPTRNRRRSYTLDLAIVAEADVMVSIDNELRADRSRHKIPIVSPEEYVSWYGQA